jgi:hypothetical protein
MLKTFCASKSLQQKTENSPIHLKLNQQFQAKDEYN